MPNPFTKLLIVDDEPVLRMVLSAIFTQAGLSVRTAEDGFSAIAAMRQEMPDILLSDLNMPGMCGFELLSLVRRRFPAMPIIAMSGAFTGEGMQLGAAADYFYEKGSSLPNLLRMVEDATSRKRQLLPVTGPPLPLWVRKHGHDLEGPYAIIACPECLRSFPQTLDEVERIPLHQTSCEHCRSPIEYALLEPGYASMAQALQRKPNAVAPPLSVVANPQGHLRHLRRHTVTPGPPASRQPLQRLRPAG